MEESKAYLLDVMATCGRAFQAVPFQEVAKTVERPNSWTLFAAYQKALAQWAAADLMKRWGDRLGGAEAYMEDNCWRVIEAMGVELAPPVH